MRIPFDRESEIPIYAQLGAHLREGIHSKMLETGSRLPSIRQMADDLGVNRATVERAYAELEAEGLVETRVGSGTYVLPVYRLPDSDDCGRCSPRWQQAALERFPYTPRELPEYDDSVIRFDGGQGNSTFFPMDDFSRMVREIMRRDGAATMQHGSLQGTECLRTEVARILASQGTHTSPDNILVLSGIQNAISLVAHTLLRPGDAVLVEAPSYTGAIDLFRSHGLRLLTVPVDENGMRTDMVEQILKEHSPRLIYTIPNFQNPTGSCMCGARRRELVCLANKYDVPVFEDDYVGDLRFEGVAQPTLKSLDTCGNVLYASSFAKMLMPSLRIGYLVAEGPVYDLFLEMKRVQTYATSRLLQRLVSDYVSVGRYEAYLRKSRREYRIRRDRLLESVDFFLPDWKPSPCRGGLFCWFGLPGDIQCTALRKAGLEHDVAVPLSSTLFAEHNGDEERFVRMNFASLFPDEIEEGVSRIARAVESMRTGK